MDHLTKLGTLPVGRLLWNMSLPACAGLLSIMLYNLVDTIFIGHYAGAVAIAGLSVVLPVLILLPTVGMAIGIGAASVISRAFGAENKARAQKAFGNALSSSILICTTVSVIGLVFQDEMLLLFGARGDILPYAKEYYQVILLGVPFVSVWMCLNNILRAEGHSRQAMIGMWFSSLLNIILDAVFIIWLGMGLKGAATATVIAQICGLMFSVRYYLKGNSTLYFSLQDMRWEWPILKEIFSLGASSLARQGAGSAMIVALNYNLYLYGGSMAVAVYGVLNRIFSVLYVPAMGTTQGFLPIAGFNYGAKQFGRVKEVLLKSILFASSTNFVLGLLTFSFPEAAIGIFTNDPVVVKYGVQGLRILTLFMPLVPIQIIGSAYFQAVGKPVAALLLSMSRQVILLIPLMFILGPIFQIKGVWAAFPVSDVVTSTLVLTLLAREWKKLREDKEEVVQAEYSQAA